MLYSEEIFKNCFLALFWQCGNFCFTAQSNRVSW